MKSVYDYSVIQRLIQSFSKSIIKPCSKCNSNRFDKILDYLSGNQEELCFKCRSRAKILKRVIHTWISNFEINPQSLNEFYTNETFRRVLKNFIKGLAIFGVRKPFITGAPLSVVWNYTKNCNLKCSHCFSDSKHNQVSENELSTEQALKVIDILKANDVVTVNFCGGEPLTREDLFEVMKYAHDNGIYPSLSTNATLLYKETCQKIFDSGVRSVSISLDSISSELHDQLRNIPGAFDMANEGIKNAVEFGKFDTLIINTTLTDYNYKEIPEIYDHVKSLGVNRYYVSRLLPTGRGKYYMEHDPSNKNKRDILNFMAEKYLQNIKENNGMTVLGRGMPYFSRTCHKKSDGAHFPVCEILTGYEEKFKNLLDGKTASLINQLASFFSGCATGLFYCGLDCDGNVIPCAPAGGIKLGNILEEGLTSIWINHPTLNRVRDRLNIKGKCSTCFASEYCGGCRLTSYGLTGDWLASDPSCPY